MTLCPHNSLNGLQDVDDYSRTMTMLYLDQGPQVREHPRIQIGSVLVRVKIKVEVSQWVEIGKFYAFGSES